MDCTGIESYVIYREILGSSKLLFFSSYFRLDDSAEESGPQMDIYESAKFTDPSATRA